jgi:hypothetical protein
MFEGSPKNYAPESFQRFCKCRVERHIDVTEVRFVFVSAEDEGSHEFIRTCEGYSYVLIHWKARLLCK